LFKNQILEKERMKMREKSEKIMPFRSWVVWWLILIATILLFVSIIHYYRDHGGQYSTSAKPVSVAVEKAEVSASPTPTLISVSKRTIWVVPKRGISDPPKMMSEDQLRRLRAADQNPNGPISRISTPQIPTPQPLVK
jgi:PDZ domain-containing secreted protein